jgi:membrane protein
MRASTHRYSYVMAHPAAFAMRVLRAFRANQALLLAGALAYYTLLSIVPLLTLMLIALSSIIDQEALLDTLRRYLGSLIPGQSTAVVAQLAIFLDHRKTVGWVLGISMVFFSSLAFTVLENSMSVIFLHRVVSRRRHFLVSAVIPYAYIVCLGCGLLLITMASGLIEAMGAQSVDVLGHSWSLYGVSGALLYLLGIGGEVFVLTSIYLVMPIGTPSWRHALIGGLTATALWEITRRILVWYFGTLSQVGAVYGSLTTAVVALASLEFAATLLLLGAQVIAEYERIGMPGEHADPKPLQI